MTDKYRDICNIITSVFLTATLTLDLVSYLKTRKKEKYKEPEIPHLSIDDWEDWK